MPVWLALCEAVRLKPIRCRLVSKSENLPLPLPPPQSSTPPSPFAQKSLLPVTPLLPAKHWDWVPTSERASEVLKRCLDGGLEGSGISGDAPNSQVTCVSSPPR